MPNLHYLMTEGMRVTVRPFFRYEFPRGDGSKFKCEIPRRELDASVTFPPPGSHLA